MGLGFDSLRVPTGHAHQREYLVGSSGPSRSTQERQWPSLPCSLDSASPFGRPASGPSDSILCRWVHAALLCGAEPAPSWLLSSQAVALSEATRPVGPGVCAQPPVVCAPVWP